MNFRTAEQFSSINTAIKSPKSFTGIFTDTMMTDMMQSRHNDYNYQNVPAVRKNLENFPLKQIIFNWNFLSLDLKATADPLEFDLMKMTVPMIVVTVKILSFD